jgi:hypothetical protein
MYFFEKLKEKGMVFWMRRDFAKKAFVLKIVSNWKDEDKPSKGLVCCMKV